MIVARRRSSSNATATRPAADAAAERPRQRHESSGGHDERQRRGLGGKREVDRGRRCRKEPEATGSRGRPPSPARRPPPGRSQWIEPIRCDGRRCPATRPGAPAARSPAVSIPRSTSLIAGRASSRRRCSHHCSCPRGSRSPAAARSLAGVAVAKADHPVEDGQARLRVGGRGRNSRGARTAPDRTSFAAAMAGSSMQPVSTSQRVRVEARGEVPGSGSGVVKSGL